jgi:hypothetical protein
MEVRCRRYDHREVGGRVTPGAVTENYVEHDSREGGVTSPWTGEGRTMHDYMDVGDRVTQEIKPRSNCRE